MAKKSITYVSKLPKLMIGDVGIAKMPNGHLWVENKVGEGSEMYGECVDELEQYLEKWFDRWF